MKTTMNKTYLPAHRIWGLGWAGQPKTTTFLLIAIAAVAISGNSHAQTLIGSPGAGWQTWTLGDNNTIPSDLNDNGAPYWDVLWETFSNSYGGYPADKNAGFCLTSTGDCQGVGSGALAPGALPFWAMPYNSANDAGGARDNAVYFRSTGSLRATLYLNFSANLTEINEFGWFETNAAGTVIRARHKLFQGSGEPTGSLTPDPVGTSVTFNPTRYFGYYYSDVSEPACPDGTPTPCANPAAPLHGCYAYTLFNFNDGKCTEAIGQQGDHDLIVFSGNATSSSHPTYWVVGEDPADCTDLDGDCNLTMVKVTPAGN